jgi:hypothetical protein
VRYLILIATVAALVAAWLFPRAFPVVVLENRITAEEARQRADSFARTHELPTGVRVAVRFERDDYLLTFIDLAGGGKDTIAALVRGRDVSPYHWSVRTMTPREIHETSVRLSADGRVIGFERRLAEVDERPPLPEESAREVARAVLTEWLGEGADRWRPVATSHETRKQSGRLDQTFTFERVDRRIATAPIRIDIVIAGDTPVAARRYVEIPQGFSRRYAAMRSVNELYSIVASVALVGLLIAGAATLRCYARRNLLRWRAPLIVGGFIGMLAAATGLNELPTSWYYYDTATSPAVFMLQVVAGSVAIGVMLALVVTMTLAAAEVATRVAFPHHADWWKLWRYRGTREVAARVLGGYTLAAVALAYVVVFYLVTRRYLGWWVPTELLDDPNLIATPMPWLAGIAMSLQAAVWEEALFRALPLSLLSLWVGTRPGRNWWMAGGVIATALVFGFAHSDYPSWPAYSRGVEIFLDAVLWAVVFLRFGLIVTVVAHFLYNATLFSIFAAGGDALPYRITALVMAVALLAPALAVAHAWMRRRLLTEVPEEGRFAAWAPVAPPPRVVAPGYSPPAAAGTSHGVALAAIIVAVALAILAPAREPRGAIFTKSRADVGTIADSLLLARGVNPEAWTRLVGTRSDTLTAWRDYLRRYDAESLAVVHATTYAVPVVWLVRYVRTEGTLADREEEWRVRLRPDGVPVDVRRFVADSAPGGSPSQPEARAVARGALAAAGLDTSVFVEADIEETARPARLDTRLTYTDTTVELPAGAAARAWVSLAGGEAVAVQRGIELPELFVRENVDRRTTRLLFSGLGAMVLISIVVAGTIAVIRRGEPVMEEDWLARRGPVMAAAVVAVFMLLTELNGLPASRLGYDTARPWTTFVTTNALGSAVGAVLFAMVAGGLWMTVSSLRRRVGIPDFPPPAVDRERWRGSIVAGVALGAVAAAASIARDAVASGIPPAPQTSMDQAAPIAAGVLSLPISVAVVVPVIAIPLLLILAVARTTAARIALALLLVVLAGATASGLTDGTPSLAATMTSLGGLLAVGWAVWRWGGISVLTWITAALALAAITGLHSALGLRGITDRVGEGVAVAAAVGALLWLFLAVRRGYTRPGAELPQVNPAESPPPRPHLR